MQYRGVNQLRELFLSYFEEKGCLRLNSFSLVPHNDNSLLIINSGMAPMKPWFTGAEIPPKRRVTTCQKCIRTGDLENVGKTARHGTFFEMLGNFSFGDYFKKEAIPWAWEFLTERVGLDPKRLYPSVYVDDVEAYNIWLNDMHIPADHIFKFGKADNFWEHGSGPCGPCTEIYYDRGEKYGNGPEDVMGGEGDRFMEIWNVVFTQYYNDGKNNYTDLNQKNIDTGMGLERLAVAVQDVGSIFDIDTLKSLRDLICSIAGNLEYGKEGTQETDVSVRICTDHARSMTFMISDGIMPSNNGRGYVLRRIIRRAVRHGRKLGIVGSFLTTLSEKVIETSRDGYPELWEKKDFILSVIRAEEEKFEKTYEQGMEILSEMEEALRTKGLTQLSGEDAFRLYDTYGFPIDNTKEIMGEKGFDVDEEGFIEAMNSQKLQARKDRMASGKNADYNGHVATIYESISPDIQSSFVGYDSLCEEGKVVSIVVFLPEGDEVRDAISDGQEGAIITDRTPFYGTMGGQIGDCGFITIGSDSIFEVKKTEHVAGNKIAHIGTVKKGMIILGNIVTLNVDGNNRFAISRNHSATHLLQKALRVVLGSHVEQSGSYQDAKRTRFDFSHFQAMTTEELKRVENLVNEQIQLELTVETGIMTLDEAKRAGAMALFGEKYGDEVRVVRMGDFSTELCGGTHVNNTRQIGYFKILSESSVAAGVRRIEAITGNNVIDYYQSIEIEFKEVAGLIKVSTEQVPEKIRNMLKEIKNLNLEIEALKAKAAKDALGDVMDTIRIIKGIKLLASSVVGLDMNDLRELGDSLKEKLGEGVVVLLSNQDGRVNVVVMATDGAVNAGVHAGNLIRDIAGLVGGAGGGRPNIAQAGGKNPEGIVQAIEKSAEILELQLN